MPWWESIFRRRNYDTHLDAEVEFHVEQTTQSGIAEGLSPQEARRALREFGGREQLKEELRDLYRVQILEATAANLRSAVRFIRKSPSFSLAIILTLTLGIGANSAVFSAIDAILLRPLPFPNGNQLMSISQFSKKAQGPPTFVAPTRLEDWNRLNSTFQAISGYYTDDTSEISGAFPEKLTNALVAPRFLQVWGISPALGRDFTLAEERFGGPHAVIISDRFWRRRFAADPQIIGKNLRIGGASLPIVGVMPTSFFSPIADVDFWSPSPPDAPVAQDRDSTWFTVIGRLKPGVTIARARANLATVQGQLAGAFPKTDGDLSVDVQSLKETTIGGVRRSLWILLASVSLLLLIACTNIVALLLARAVQRQHEIAVRFSLGASRAAIVVQLLTETFVLTLIGAVLGLAVAQGASKIFRVLAGDLPRVGEIHLDTRILLYTLACSVIVTLLCGLLPAIRSTRNISGSLARANRTQVSSKNPLQWLLVGIQVALAVTLLTGAGLLFRSFQALGRVTPGFEPTHILTFHVSGSWSETTDMPGLTQRIDRTLDTLRAISGVENAATAAVLPGVPSDHRIELKFSEGAVDPAHKILAEIRFVSPSYFATMHIPLLAGDLCRQKLDGSEILVNRSFADTYLLAPAPLGRHIGFVDRTFLVPGEIRGIVGNAREAGLNREPSPTLYWCLSAPDPDPYYLVRTHTAPMVSAEAIRYKIHEIAPDRSVFDVTPLAEHLESAFAEDRLRRVLLTFFAATAISLACIGLYGTLNYSVSTRQREIGLRLALGALRPQLVRQFFVQGLRVAAVGCGVGLLLAAASTRLLSGMLYGVSPSDFTTFASVVAIVLLVAAMASLIPSLRASRVEPMDVLREE
jgi:putative ABC transport system permease protein